MKKLRMEWENILTKEEKILVFQALNYLMSQIDVKGKEGWELVTKIYEKLQELE